MKLVIDIDDEIYSEIKNKGQGKWYCREMDNAIRQCTPPCEDCISRQVVFDLLEDINVETEGVGFYYEHYVEYIKNSPSVTLKEKTGHWIGDKCSNCGNERAWYGNNPKFCPDCGAKMEF